MAAIDNTLVHDKDYIAVGKQRENGAITVGPATKSRADIPETADAKVDEDRFFVGYVDASGVTRTENSDKVTKRDMRGVDYYVLRTGESVELRLRLGAYANGVTQALLYGLGVDVSQDGKTMTTTVGGNEAPRVSWDFRLTGNSNLAGMLWAPDAQVSGHSDIVYGPDDTISVEITLTLFADDDGHYLYEAFTIQTEDGKFEVPDFTPVDISAAADTADTAA